MGTWSSSFSNSANSFIMERRAVASSLLPANPHHRTRYCQTKRATYQQQQNCLLISPPFNTMKATSVLTST
jgi:hypothetical protein